MTDKQKQFIIESGKQFFRKSIIPNHIKNLNKLQLKDFDINPFLINYLAAFMCGDTTPTSIAKALVYPRVLGTSINTTFGAGIQTFITELRQITSSGSAIPGIDIEFVDAVDGRKKYCQCKAGPKTINNDDVATILGHFKQFKGIARQNRLHVSDDDLIVGILYGEVGRPSASYKAIAAAYPVFCGVDFWERLTGDKTFYHRLAKAFGEVVEEDKIDGSQLITQKVNELARQIIEKGGI